MEDQSITNFIFKFLNLYLRRVLMAFAGRIIPEDREGEKVYPGADNPGSIAIIERALSTKPKDMVLLIKVFLLFVEFSGLLFALRPFSWMSAEQQDKHLRRFEFAPLGKIRQGFWGLKTLVFLSYYSRDEIWPDIHYPGPRMKRPHPDSSLRALQTAPFKRQ
jgi:hypothetical protein